MDLWKVLGIDRQGEKGSGVDWGTLFDAISGVLEGLPHEDVKRVTGIAGLLGKVAYADRDISEREVERIRRTLTEMLHLESAHVESILALLLDHRIQLFAVEDHVYARLVNEVASRQQKCELLRVLFTVAAADRSISEAEDRTIRLVADGLQLSHREFIDARSGFNDRREIFRDPR